MGRRTTCKLLPPSREAEIQWLGHALDSLPDTFLETLRASRKTAREVGARMRETRALMLRDYPHEVQREPISSKAFEVAGFPRVAEMMRLMKLAQI